MQRFGGVYQHIMRVLPFAAFAETLAEIIHLLQVGLANFIGAGHQPRHVFQAFKFHQTLEGEFKFKSLGVHHAADLGTTPDTKSKLKVSNNNKLRGADKDHSHFFPSPVLTHHMSNSGGVEFVSFSVKQVSTTAFWF